jgi:hypothetical protein
MRKNGKVIRIEKLRVNGTLVEVPLRLVADERNSRGGIPKFDYEVNMDDPPIRVSHADPGECLNLAKAALEIALSIRWEPVIVVSVTEGGDVDRFHGYGKVIGDANLSLRVTLVERGTRTDGEVLFQCRDSSGKPRTAHPDEGTIIPDTESNRQRVVAICEGLDRLGKQLHDLLSEAKIQKTLTNVKLLALPAPPPERPRARRNPRS